MRFALAAIVGAVIFVLVGYFAYAAPGEAVSLGYWLSQFFRFGVWLWAALGAALGASVYLLAARR